jgi:ketosteroid isomerase-like protein
VDQTAREAPGGLIGSGFVAAITEADAAVLAARHIAEFNEAVAARNFSQFLGLFTDDAVIRFENVPGAGTLEFAGRDAYTQAYAEQPPDDKIDISGAVTVDGDVAVVPFVWRHDEAPGTMRLRFTAGSPDALDERLVSSLTVTFG